MKDLEAKVRGYFKKISDGIGGEDILLTFDYGQNSCTINIEKAYQSPSYGELLNFEVLSYLSELYGTTHLNTGEAYYTRGCRTCDYGAKDRVELYITGVTYSQVEA